MRIIYGWKFRIFLEWNKQYIFNIHSLLRKILYGAKSEIFLEGVSVLYIYGLSAEVRPPCFDSGCCLG